MKAQGQWNYRLVVDDQQRAAGAGHVAGAGDLGAQRRQGTGRETMVEVGDDADALLLPVGSVDDAIMLMGLVLPEPGTPPDVTGRDLMLEAMMAKRTTSHLDAPTAS